MNKASLSLLLALLLFLLPGSGQAYQLTDDQKMLLSQAAELSCQGQFTSANRIILELLQQKVHTASVEFYTGFLVEKLKSDQHASLHHYKQAIKLIDASPEKDPLLQAMVWFYMSYSYDKLKDEEKSENAINATFAILDKLNSVGKLSDGIGYYMLAYCYDKHNQKELSVEFYLKAIKFFEDRQLNYYYLRGALYNIGLYHYNNSDFKEAARFWKQAYEMEPADGYFKQMYEQWYTIASEQAKDSSPGSR